MNRINRTLKTDKKLLSIYFTAGYPALEDTVPVIEKLQEAGVDMIEIGLPFSDPLADGPTIQESSARALKNGMTTRKLFSQLENIRKTVDIPLLIMGYFNPVLQYGVEDFCKTCRNIGIDGLIIPDLPVAVYDEHYRELFSAHGLINVFLITPQTSEERVRFIDSVSEGFIYMVSTASVTGARTSFEQAQSDYFKRIADMQLKSPQIVGFGISNAVTFNAATAYAKGGIIGSAFIQHLTKNGVSGIDGFVTSFR